MGKNGKKSRYDKRGKQVSILKIGKIPIFFHDSPNLDLGMGKNVKNGQKKYVERKEKSIRFNTLLLYYYHYFLHIKQDLSSNILYYLTMTLSSHYFTSNLNIYTAHKNDWPL